MIQDIEPHIFKNEYSNSTITEEDYILIFHDNSVLLLEAQEIKIPTLKQFNESYPNINIQVQYLFGIDDRNYYLAWDTLVEAKGKWKYISTGELRDRTPMWKAFACTVGEQLNRWYFNHIYCGRCGSLLDKSETERALPCKKCGNIIYPTLSPSVIVGIVDGDRILLTKYANRIFKKYALVAGYCEIGESLEETVKREVFEEVGLHVKNIRYYKSQPWPFSDCLLVGYFADLDGLDEVNLQEDELSEAVWFKRDEIPNTDSNISLTNEMIEFFRNYQ